MKDIYDEAIENLRSVMAKFIIPSVEDSDYGCLYDLCHFYNTLDKEENEWLRSVYNALERAKKVEELLELYQNLWALPYGDIGVVELLRQIEQLEKELRELK